MTRAAVPGTVPARVGSWLLAAAAGPWLLAAAAASGTLAIAAEALDQRALYMAAKPLTTTLIIAWAWPRGSAEPARQRALRIGLLCSLLGDVALLWPREGFLPGLVAFLLAHLAYLVLFGRARPRPHGWQRAVPALGYAAVAAAMLAHLWPGVPAALRGPVLAYVGALGGMAALAASAWLGARGHEPSSGAQGLGGAQALAWRGALGGLLFLLSDAILATNRFAGPVPAAGAAILTSYWLAQVAIAGCLPAARPVPRAAGIAAAG